MSIDLGTVFKKALKDENSRSWLTQLNGSCLTSVAIFFYRRR